MVNVGEEGDFTRASLDLERLCQPEVEDLYPPLGRHLDVGGLEIAMDDPLGVRRFERFGDLPEDRDRLVGRHRAALEPFGQVLTRHELHLDQRAIAKILETVQRRDVRVIQRREHAGLALEAAAPIGRVGHRLGKQLHRDFTTEPQVLRPIHFAHASRANRGKNFVGADGRSWRELHAGDP